MAVVMVMVLIPAAAHSEGTSATPVTPPKPAERARPAGPDKVRTQEAPPDTFEKAARLRLGRPANPASSRAAPANDEGHSPVRELVSRP